MPSVRPRAAVSAQDHVNGTLYRRPHLVGEYTPIQFQLTPPEAITLVRNRDDIQGRRVLDLGCGAGRLATFLRPLAGEYVGFDLSPHMVAHCRQRFTDLRFEVGDMRDLTRFAAGSFDAVFAVFNLFDAVSHEDRQQVFAEVRRILTPNGLLAFSSHNRNAAAALAGPRLRFARNPLRQLRCAVDYFQEISNHRRIKPMQRFESDYALLNDSGHQYSVLHYYVTRQAQTRQLSAAGFRLMECLDEQGRTLGAEDADGANCSLHYLARPSEEASEPEA